MTVKNTFREGSTCHRAFRLLEQNGATVGIKLAQALGFDEDELPGLLGLALRSGHIRRTYDRWEIGDGTPQATPPVPTAPAPPPTIQTAVVPPAVRELPAAAPKFPAPPPKEPVSPTMRAKRVLEHKANERMSRQLDALPPAPPAPASAGVDIDRVHIGQFDVSIAEAPPAPADEEGVVAAFCSDGTYRIQKGSSRVDLGLADIFALYDHLSTVRKGLQP